MGACGIAFLFTVLTLLTIGASCALFIAAIVYLAKIQIQSVSETLWVAVIIAMCASFLILCFGIYASWWGKACSRTIVLLIYIIYALVLGAIGIALLALKNTLMTEFGKLWEGEPAEARKKIEEFLKCKGWTSENEVTPSCKAKVDEFYGKYGGIIGGCLLGLFVILMAGSVWGFYLTCKGGQERSDTDTPRRNNVREPLAYSW
jgi:hypothetical protein